MRLDHLVRLISQPWVIHPEVLENWASLLDAKLSGHPLPADLVAAGRQRPRDNDELFVRDGNLAIVPAVGTLVKANSHFTCDATYGEIRQAVAAAEQAKGIDAVMIDGDTPGGTFAGAQETGDFLHRVGQRKPLYGWVDDLAASGGYWLLSQTRMIGAHAGADVGSVGVLTVHYDRSGRDAQAGVRRTVLAVGDFKALGNDTVPLNDEARGHIMERLNQSYDLFIAAVSRGRKLSSAKIRAMQSRVYKSAQAKELGLIDHIMGRDEYIDFIKKQTRGAVSSFPSPARTIPVTKGAKNMNIEQIRKEQPDLVAQIESAVRAEERLRVLAVVTSAVGETAGAKIALAVNSGLLPEQLAALGVQFVDVGGVDKESRAAILQAIIAAAPAGLRTALPGIGDNKASLDAAGIYAARAQAVDKVKA